MVKTQIRVIYGDTDQMGVVYYANYLRYFEAGRNEFIRSTGHPYRDIEREFHVHLPVVEAHVAYKQAARYDDLLTLETALGRVGRASVKFDYRLMREGTLLAAGHTVHACIDAAGGVCRIPHQVVSWLAPDAGPTHG